jgi:hypothetical protein
MLAAMAAATPLIRSSARWLLAASVIVAVGVRAPVAAAQGNDVALDLLSQESVVRGPEEPLGIELAVTNSGPTAIEGLQVTISVGERVESRSSLHDSLDDPDATFAVSSFTPYGDEEARVAPGATRRIKIDSRTLRLDSLARTDEGGVYPLVIRVHDGAGEPLDALVTPFIYYPNKVDGQLILVLAWALGDAPGRAPDGTFPVDPATGRSPLEAAVEPGGWLQSTLATIVADGRAGVDLGLAPAPRLVEELADMSDGYVREGSEGAVRVPPDARTARFASTALDLLRTALLDRPGVQHLFVPYGAPDLPTITRHVPDPTNLADHFDAGEKVLRDWLGAPVDTSWLLPAAGRLDVGSLRALQEVEPTRPAFKTFFSPGSLEGLPAASAGCPRPFGSFTCPVVVEADDPARGFVADEVVQQRMGALARPGDNALDLQRMLAETAVIREELPGEAGRVLHVSIPALWHPAPQVVKGLLGDLAGAPWLESMTPEEALSTGAPDRARVLAQSAPPLEGAPEGGLFASVRDARAALNSFRAVEPPVERHDALLRDVLAAQARAWMGDVEGLERAADYAEFATRTAQSQLGNISIGGRTRLTLTSRNQLIPLVLFNDNDYSVTVDVHLEATELDFARSTFQGVRLHPGNNPFTAEARARSSGNFPLTVCVTGPGESCGGAGAITRANISVSSTQFNKVALGLTIGALVFLVLFYAARAVRRRRRATSEISEFTPA